MNEIVLVERKIRSKEEKEKVKISLACIRTVAFTIEVTVNMLILMKTVIFICRGRNTGVANAETYRDKQGYTRTNRDRQGETRTCRDRQGHSLGLINK